VTASPPRTFGLPVLLGVAAGALVLGLLAGLLAGVAGTSALFALRQDAGSPSTRPAAQALPEELDRLREFVAETRGLEWRREVPVEVLPPQEFEQAFVEGPPLADSMPDHLPSTLQSLGLVDDAAAVSELLADDGAAYVDGFYDGRRVVVRATGWTPAVEVTVVHELTHALQDQHFALDRLMTGARMDDETALAALSVVEGDASWVEEQYALEQSGEWNEELWASYDASQADIDLPPAVQEMLWAPYNLGWSFATDLRSIGGHEAVGRAFRHPPTTLEQVWDAQAWFDGDASVADAVAVAAPRAPEGTHSLGQGTLGSHLLAMLAAEDEWFTVEDGPLPGWAGDRYVTWATATSTCTAVDVALDSDTHVTEALDLLDAWLGDGGAASAEGTLLSLQRCVA